MFGTGRGQGRGRGMGRGMGRGLGQGRGMGRNRPAEGGRGQGRCGKGMGPEGVCVCPKCGTEIPHTPGVSCVDQKCPKCGSRMIRKGIN